MEDKDTHQLSFAVFFSSTSKAPSPKDQTYEDMTSDGTPLQLLQLLLHWCVSLIRVCIFCVFVKKRKRGKTGGFCICCECLTVNILGAHHFCLCGKEWASEQVLYALVKRLSCFPQDLKITSALNLTVTRVNAIRPLKTCILHPVKLIQSQMLVNKDEHYSRIKTTLMSCQIIFYFEIGNSQQ